LCGAAATAPDCEGCGIEINARTGIIYEHVNPGRPWRRTDTGLAEDRRHPRQAGVEAEALAVAAKPRRLSARWQAP
jgi:hypothetical protein